MGNKLTAEEGLSRLKNAADLKGGRLLSLEWKTSLGEYQWECSNLNHPPWIAKYGNIVHLGQWCKLCHRELVASKQEKSLDRLIKYVFSKKGIFTPHEWKGSHFRYHFKCRFNHEWNVSYHDMIGYKTWCPECAKIDISLNPFNRKSHFQAEEEAKLVNRTLLEIYKGNTSRHKYMCLTCGKIAKTAPKLIKKGVRCRSCASVEREEKLSPGPGVVALNKYFYSYKSRAPNRGLAFDLTLDQFKELINSNNCFWCNRMLTECGVMIYGSSGRRKLKRNEYGPVMGIDRVDNNLGYVRQNCVPCCKFCNMLKRDTPLQEWLDFLARIRYSPVHTLETIKQQMEESKWSYNLK